MLYDITSYILFLSISFYVTIKLGWVFYKNGEVYLYEIFKNQTAYVQKLNKLLLIGYYLVNLGKAALTITFWENITTTEGLITIVSHKLGSLLILLAIMHFINLIGLYILSKKTNSTEISQ